MEKSVSKRQNSGSQVIMSDMISKLPDSLLQHILSFLPMETVVATSLLSKRWRSLWLSMPTLYFDDRKFHSLDFFIQFVDTVLILGDLNHLKMFRLKCRTFYVYQERDSLTLNVPPNKVKLWMKAAMNRKVEHLELYFQSGRSDIGLPSHIFNCSTIRVLKLFNVRVNTVSSVNMPSLKAMHLVTVQFPDLKCMGNLLCGCALLEELVMDDREIDKSNLTLDIERLEHLVSADIRSFLIASKAFSNVTHLRLSTDMRSPDRDIPMSSDRDIPMSPDHDIPIFDNLTHIEFCCDADDLNWIVECLRNFPKLEVLQINEIWVNPDEEGRMLEPILDVPQCISSQLKEFTLDKYEGSECEFEIVRFILENASILRTISICSGTGDAKWQLEMLKRLSLCPRGSKNCKLLFE